MCNRYSNVLCFIGLSAKSVNLDNVMYIVHYCCFAVMLSTFGNFSQIKNNLPVLIYHMKQLSWLSNTEPTGSGTVNYYKLAF